jgi:hypothetical protein
MNRLLLLLSFFFTLPAYAMIYKYVHGDQKHLIPKIQHQEIISPIATNLRSLSLSATTDTQSTLSLVTTTIQSVVKKKISEDVRYTIDEKIAAHIMGNTQLWSNFRTEPGTIAHYEKNNRPQHTYNHNENLVLTRYNNNSVHLSTTNTKKLIHIFMHQEPIKSCCISDGVAVMNGKYGTYDWVQFTPNKQQAYLCNLLFTWLLVKKHPHCQNVEGYIDQIVRHSTTGMFQYQYKKTLETLWETLPRGVRKNISLRILSTLNTFPEK